MTQILENIVDWIFWLMFMFLSKVIYPLLLLIFILCFMSIVFLVVTYPIMTLIDYIKRRFKKMKHTQEEIDAAKKMVQDDMGCECSQPMIDMTGEDNGTTTFQCWNCGHIVVYFKEEHNE